MRTHHAPGLHADWLNAWLAAIGITVLVPSARLSWTTDAIPHAQLHAPTDDLAATVHAALPSDTALQELAIARHRDDAEELPRKVTLAAYHSRVPIERDADHPTLAHSVTDLAPAQDGDLVHSPFDVPAPKGLTLWQRAASCRSHITDPADIGHTLQGTGRRVKDNGLGFDVRRLASRADDADKLTDPVVETLAFAALALFPIRGNGRAATCRGWSAPSSRPRAFQWGTWTAALDRWAIDAWLDRFHHDTERDVTARYATMPYRQSGSADPTRAYAATRLA